MPQGQALELKPSELKTLTATQQSLADTQQQLEAPIDRDSETWPRDRERALKKAASTLARSERSLSRMPVDHAEVEAARAQIEALQERIDQAQAELAAAVAGAEAEAAADLKALQTLLASADTKANIERMHALALQFRDVWQTFQAIDGRYTHGLFTLWDEQTISLLLYILENRDDLQAEARLLLDTYTPLLQTNDGIRVLSTALSDLRTHSETLAEKLPEFIALLPRAQELAAAEFLEAVEKQQRIFRQANKERDTSALLQLNPQFPQLDSGRTRMLAQERIYEAIGGPQADAIRALRREALARAEAAGNEIAQWQSAQRGREAEELQRQQAEAAARSKANEERAAADHAAWLERRKRLDAEREAQHQRNIALRQVRSESGS